MDEDITFETSYQASLRMGMIMKTSTFIKWYLAIAGAAFVGGFISTLFGIVLL